MSTQFTKEEIQSIRITVGVMREQYDRGEKVEPWLLKFLEWAITMLPSGLEERK